MRLLALLPLAAATLASAAVDFDHPFNSTSIWNTRIGQNATYAGSGLGNPTDEAISTDREYFVWCTSSDPWRTFYYPNTNTVAWFNGYNVPNWFAPEAWNTTPGPGYYTPNNCTTFVKWPDLVEMQPTLRRSDMNVSGYPAANDSDNYNINGSGRKGTHYGSSLSAMGGSLRRVNLNESQIQHALKVNVWGRRYLYRFTPQGSQTGPGYRWPAYNADSGFTDSNNGNYYGGNNNQMAMGSLLAIPRWTNLNNLGLQTELGRKLAWTLQHYGAYIVDNTAGATRHFCVERYVEDDVQRKYGQSFTGPANSGSQIVQDLRKLFNQLQVVTNNGPTSVGGGGTPIP